MQYIRIRSYLTDGTFTTCEHLYFGNNQSEALARFRSEYPEHDGCILVAENYNSEEHEAHFKACLNCGCVH